MRLTRRTLLHNLAALLPHLPPPSLGALRTSRHRTSPQPIRASLCASFDYAPGPAHRRPLRRAVQRPPRALPRALITTACSRSTASAPACPPPAPTWAAGTTPTASSPATLSASTSPASPASAPPPATPPATIKSARPRRHGFAATLGPQNQSILRPETNLWTCYTLDKHFAGLIDAAHASPTSLPTS